MFLHALAWHHSLNLAKFKLFFQLQDMDIFHIQQAKSLLLYFILM